MLLRTCKVWTRTALVGAFVALGGGAASAEPLSCHGTASPYRLEIAIQGVRNNRGFVVANIYGTDRHRWLADKGELAIWRDPATPGDETMCVYLPSPGRYAVVVFHDANGNGDLDMGPLGPKEAFGFSNNVRPILSPPLLRSALFDAGLGATHITIRLRYPPML